MELLCYQSREIVVRIMYRFPRGRKCLRNMRRGRGSRWVFLSTCWDWNALDMVDGMEICWSCFLQGWFHHDVSLWTLVKTLTDTLPNVLFHLCFAFIVRKNCRLGIRNMELGWIRPTWSMMDCWAVRLLLDSEWLGPRVEEVRESIVWYGIQ